jgi:putative flavoprotein involved in K+ transport
MPEAHSMAIAWLTRLSEAVSHANPGESLATLFTPSGVLRDSLVFSWDVRSLSGPPVIADHVSRGVETRGTLSDVRSEEIDGTRIFFTFRTALGAGRGSAELASDGQAQWMFLMLDKINGHAETLPKDSVKYRVDSTQAPYVVVGECLPLPLPYNLPIRSSVGAGQTGLTIAARLRRLGIPTLLFERTPRVGDSWRTRYDGLILNTPKEHHSCEPYIPRSRKFRLMDAKCYMNHIRTAGRYIPRRIISRIGLKRTRRVKTSWFGPPRPS